MKFKGSGRMVFAAVILSVLMLPLQIYGQPVPGKDENIPFLVTFGKTGNQPGMDGHLFFQVFFVTIRKDLNKQFYIRIFDPDCGGENDEKYGEFDTRTVFSVYGGKGVDPEKYCESNGVTSDYKTGELLSSRAFGSEETYDNKYYTLGPFNLSDGDYSERWDRYIFKIVCEGVSGNDGNLYRYFISQVPDNDIPVTGANTFTYMYAFRLWNDLKIVSHLFAHVDTGVIFIKQSNFGLDSDGSIIVSSTNRKGMKVITSADGAWASSNVIIDPSEAGKSLDFQFHKQQSELIKNNNVIFTIEDQNGVALPFISSPAGGVPHYDPTWRVKSVKK